MTQIGYMHVALEVWGGIFCCIIALSILLTRDMRDRRSRLFVVMQLTNTFVLFCDAIAWTNRGNMTRIGFYLVRISNFLVFFLNYALLFIFTRYIYMMIGRRTKPNPVWKNIIDGTGILYIMVLVVSQFSHLFYYFDEQNFYHRGSFFWVTQAVGIWGMLLILIVLIRYREKLSRIEFLSMISYAVLPVAATVLQIFYYGISMLNIAITISMMLLFLSFQSEQTRTLIEQEGKLKDLQMKIILSQIQPHFLYNSLNAIYYLCGKDPEKAQQAISDFSDFLRCNLDSLRNSAPVYFDKELKHIRIYLSLEQLRYDEELTVEYDIQVTGFLLPSLSVQPLVENAVKYGVGKKPGGGTVKISTREHQDAYEIVVGDDGVGYDPNEIQNDGRTHTGIENVTKRLESLFGGTLDIQSKAGEGTMAVIRIPKQKSNWGGSGS